MRGFCLEGKHCHPDLRPQCLLLEPKGLSLVFQNVFHEQF